MKKVLYFLILALPLFLPGCDIWEDRADCPKILTLDCNNLEGKALNADIWIFLSEHSLISRTRIGEHDFSTLQEYAVKQGHYTSVVWTGLGTNTVLSDMNTLSGYLTKVPGKDADPLFTFTASREVTKDSVLIRVVPKKMFIDVSVVLKGLAQKEHAEVDIVSRAGGFTMKGDVLDGSSLVSSEGDGLVRMRIMRPYELDGMEMNILCSFADGEKLSSDFNLGGYLKSAGYDLSGNDLKDVMVTVDVNRMRASIGTDPLDFVPPVVIRY